MVSPYWSTVYGSDDKVYGSDNTVYGSDNTVYGSDDTVYATLCVRLNARVDQKISDDWISSDTDGPVFVLSPRM